MEDTNTPRPDLNDLPDDVVAYIEALEAELLMLKRTTPPKRFRPAQPPTATDDPDEAGLYRTANHNQCYHD
jgi:hypothetical protein